jgi:phosphoadenosine phosphosulfate reductase
MSGADLPDRLALLPKHIDGRLVFTTSFGLEDQAITHAIFASGLDLYVELVTLDTGRLFPETYDLWAQTEERYGRRITAVSPDRSAVENFVAQHGINGFRQSLDARKACCGIRKVEPLGRALAGAAAWITGLRAEQSSFRAAVPLAEQDRTYGLIKVNPLADWSRQDLVRYVVDNAIPYNPLHDRGYPSIGCAPCTRALRLGEPERAGRWWWENEAKKECGLHLRPVPSSPQDGPKQDNHQEVA